MYAKNIQQTYHYNSTHIISEPVHQFPVLTACIHMPRVEYFSAFYDSIQYVVRKFWKCL